MKYQNITTKYGGYKVTKPVSRHENEAEFSCHKDCIKCLGCDFGYSTMEIINGGL